MWDYVHVLVVASPHICGLPAAAGMSSMSKAKSQTFDPFADLGNLGPTLPGETPVLLV